VLAVLAAGTLAGDTVAAVTMGAGAMLVGVAWRTGGGIPPVAAMAADAAVMGLATFAGSATGQVRWLHIVVLVVWSYAAGLIVAVGRRGAIVGTQAIIAFVVFGRFAQPAPAAAGLAALVIFGGAVQVVFCALFGGPSALRIQRSAVAEAYRRLAALTLDPDARSADAGAALDEAELRVTSPALLGDAATMTLLSLVQEGRRMRLELAATALLLAQYGRAHPDPEPMRSAVDHVRGDASAALGSVAGVVDGSAEPDSARASLAPLHAAADAVAESGAPAGREAGDAEHLARTLQDRAMALAGQVRAAAGLAAGLRERRGRIAVRPSLDSAGVRDRLLADLDQIRANASLRSPAGRHAVRLAVIVPALALIADHVPLQRSYWIVVAAATVLRPDFGSTFTRGAERMVGTCIGVVLAGVLAVALHPTGWATVALVGVLGWAAYAVFPASFAAGIVFLNAMIVFLLEAVAPSTLSVAFDRGVDTLVGGTIALIAYVLWPTWSGASAREALAALAAAHRAYLHAVLDAIVDGHAPAEGELRSLARASRLAWTTAEATLERSLTEPLSRRIDDVQARGVMTGLRRLVQATHVIRLELTAGRDEPLEALRPLAGGLDRTLAIIGDALATGRPVERTTPPLRELHDRLAHGPQVMDQLLPAELDEIVDAANTVAGLLRRQPQPAPARLRAPAATSR
jgi:uncharacterized membrane protein YccC